jgi:uncharacterized membrane protein YfcA
MPAQPSRADTYKCAAANPVVSGKCDTYPRKSSMKAALFVALTVITIGFAMTWIVAILRQRREQNVICPDLVDTAVGLVTMFFDTLGIGSFATTSSSFKFWGLVRDEEIPGTLLVGQTPPSVLEAFFYLAIIPVDLLTLILMIASATAGAWLGAGVVSQGPRRKIQIGMGSALLLAAMLMAMRALNWLPLGGEVLALSGAKLVIGVGFNMVFGALMTLGVEIFAPSMVLVSLLGMNPIAAFPIMMGSAAFLMPVGSVPFIRARRYNLKAALGLTLGGIPGVLIAAFIVKSLPLAAIRWLVVAVVIYTASMMLRSAAIERRSAAMASANS